MTYPAKESKIPQSGLVPLWGFMKKIDLDRYFNIGCSVQFLAECKERAKHTQEIDLEKSTSRTIIRTLQKMKITLGHLELTHAVAQVRYAIEVLKQDQVSWERASTLFDCLRISCQSGMRSVFAGYIPAERARFWGMQKPFGEKVYESFPSARADFTAAGNCYAVEQYDACVFHMMRVAEKGLHVLAKERNIRKIGKSHVGWNEWGRIIRVLRERADKLDGSLTRGSKKDKALEFYRGAIGEMEAFKDAYRNYLIHGRITYNFDQGARIYHRVGEFMQRLSVNLSEDKAGAIKW